MSYVSDDKNYTDPKQSGVDPKVDRLGDISGDPPENKATNRELSSKLANILENLEFPASKSTIEEHINKRSPAMGNRTNDVFELINNKLKDNIEYENVYEIELATGLVKKTE